MAGKPEGGDIVIPTSQSKMSDSEDNQEKDKVWMEKYGLAMDQLAELKESFAMYDRDDEGAIDPCEVSVAIRAMGQNPSEKECQDIVNEMDLNDAGKVTLDEFIRVVGMRGVKSEPEMEEELEEAMRLFDKEGNGYCDAEELKTVLKTLGEQLEDEDISEMMKMAEVDKEGRINYLEFVRKITAK